MDLRNGAGECSTDLPVFPIDMSGGIMVKSDGKPIACGGEGNSAETILDVCYQYDSVANDWLEYANGLVGARRYAFAVELAEEEESFWITGEPDRQS